MESYCLLGVVEPVFWYTVFLAGDVACVILSRLDIDAIDVVDMTDEAVITGVDSVLDLFSDK